MSGLTTDMIVMATTAMLCDACGYTTTQAFHEWDQWLAEHDRKIAEQAWQDGWEEGQYTGEAGARGLDLPDMKYPEDNPYRKKEDAC